MEPCPFCDSANVVIKTIDDSYDNEYKALVCEGCNLTVVHHETESTLETLIEKWNKRGENNGKYRK